MAHLKLTERLAVGFHPPGEPTPHDGTGTSGGGYRTRKYGVTTFADFFTPRQKLMLLLLADRLGAAAAELERSSPPEMQAAVQACLSLVFGKVVQYNTSLCRWKASGENLVDTFGRQALPMVWDFAEASPIGGASGDFLALLEWHCESLAQNAIATQAGSAHRTAAEAMPLPDDIVDAFVTDPPYYDSVPYADLSDFFYTWMRHLPVSRSIPELFGDPLTPKDGEGVVDLRRGQDREHYRGVMSRSLAEGRRVTKPEGIGVVVFAHKTTAGWEAMLEAMVAAGWIVTASWPIDTEMSTRLRARESAALASSIHLACRPRERSDGTLRTAVGDWREILAALPRRIHEWMPRLAEEGVVGADAVFACLGPALEIFSCHARVEKASGEEVKLKEYLEHVWAAVAHEALSMIFAGADTAGFEEDARLTAMWLWTLSTTGNGKAEPPLGTRPRRMTRTRPAPQRRGTARRPRWRDTSWNTTRRARSPRAWAHISRTSRPQWR